ncbi:MAG: M23 family metallopeptidase, partial [Myxococcales bacterium]|nr:M23 family metallopeptidase [Myxococcales bacterium]
GVGCVRRVRTDLRHNGIDVAAPAGAVVRAAADGLVVYSDNTLRGLGNAVVILHPGGWTTLYAHNARNTVQPGWRVKRGERIALVGATGIARGPHLHFEWRDNGRLGDPKRLFVGRRSDELMGPLVPLDGEARPQEPEGESGTEAEPGNGAATESETESAGTEIAFPFELGTVATARRLMTRPAPNLPESVVGRRFSNLLWPVKGGYLSRGHGAGGHRGVDIAAQEGAGVRAAADGIVVYSGDGLAGMGHAVVLLHRTGWVTIYAGNRENGVQAGDQVQRGQWIGRVGRSAAGSEPHLHFEWLQAGEHRDPSPLLTAPAAP